MKHQTQNIKPSLSYRLFSTNWGLILVGGLLAFAIGAATLHNGYVESKAQEVPEVEVEAVAEAEAFIP
ncbi:MAG: hypothetical protein E7645_00085 [Ruminococcaceae bacterium]|nr:hypothetical protein [Oscillospiraceae bacterium]